eukprot:CAMPEP_0114155970 /NCGR_PEP_ID=MMETSP0043_2-20121206/25780_1 /TAXON_ID=464988 /ORGANISM="Hemiselmis andersenii, Strain CCMP644" /LENGTH=46 /DNA_ID= /DNA_START= /DNA_END= /DNA_ORIENTATION=
MTTGRLGNLSSSAGRYILVIEEREEGEEKVRMTAFASPASISSDSG